MHTGCCGRGSNGSNGSDSCCQGKTACGCGSNQAVQANPVALSKLAVGQRANVCEHCLDPKDATLLRAMGLRPNTSVRVCRQGEPCIVEVLAATPGSGPCGCNCATRIGLARDVASRVMVIPETRE